MKSIELFPSHHQLSSNTSNQIEVDLTPDLIQCEALRVDPVAAGSTAIR